MTTTSLTQNDLVISFHNSNTPDIVSTQEISICSNPSLLTYRNNILSLRKDDIQQLSRWQQFRHAIRPYENIFSTQDLQHVIHFFEVNNFKEKNIYVQCEYGRSRSLTLAMMLHKFMLSPTHHLEHDEHVIRNFQIQDVAEKHFSRSCTQII
jgi:hypothetical protein